MPESAQKTEAPEKAPEYIRVPLESVPTDTQLLYSIFINLGDKYVRLRAKGDILQSSRCQNLREKKVEALFVELQEWNDFMGSVEKGLKSSGITDARVEASTMRTALDVYWRSIEEKREVDLALYEKLKELCYRMPSAMQKNRTVAEMLLRRYQDPGLYFACHSVNVTVYSVVIGLKLRLPHSQLEELALAACFANIGIIRIPRPILYKPSDLTAEEWKDIKRHPQHGDQLLQSLLAPKSASQAALAHHERQDGAGYPSALKGDEIPLFARIITIAEVFSALSSVRPWAKPVPPHSAIEMMRQMVGKFDPRLLTSLGG